MQEGQSQPDRCTALLAVVSLLAAVTLNVVSLALPNWLQYEVDRRVANGTGFDYYTRGRGIFVTCLADSTAAPLSNAAYASQVKYTTCLDLDLGGNLASGDAGYLGGEAWAVTALRRLHIGFHLASCFALCLALIVCLVCLTRVSGQAKLFAATGLSLLAAGLQFGAQVTFNNTLMQEMLPPVSGSTATAAANDTIYNAWPLALQQATRVSTGTAYFLALATFGTCLLSAGTTMSAAVVASASQTAARRGKDYAAQDNDDSLDPTGSYGKANGQQEPMPMQPYTSYNYGNNLTVQSGGRLPRIPVNQGSGQY